MFIVRTSSYYSFYLAQQPNAGQARLFATVSGSHTRTQPQSVGLLSTGERCDAEPCTCQHTTLTTCPRQDSNPQTQQAIGGRSSPQIARSLDFKNICFGKCLLLVCVCVCVCYMSKSWKFTSCQILSLCVTSRRGIQIKIGIKSVSHKCTLPSYYATCSGCN